MKNLEDVFSEHREAFDDKEPDSNHLESFLEKLKGTQKKQVWFKKSSFLKVATIAIFVVFSGVLGYQIRKIQHPNAGLGAISPEYREVELFYTSNINNQLKMIDRMGKHDNNIQNEILADELNDMDKKYNQLKSELKLHPDDDRIIEAMIEYFEVKSNILNRIIQQLYQVRKQKKSNLNVSA